MKKEEFEALFNDPLYQRLWSISQDVQNGVADAETVKAWEELRETVTQTMEAAEQALVSHEPGDRERILRQWIEEFADERLPPMPTRH